MSSQREIDRKPVAPVLNNRAFELLTELCFRKDDELQPVDLLFVYATLRGVKEQGDVVNKLLATDITKAVVITGGAAPFEGVPSHELPEADLQLEHINQKDYPDITFYVERTSTNTLENVTEALKVYDFTQCDKVLFLFKEHVAGRGYLTLKKFLPNTQILQKSWPIAYPNEGTISRENWFETEANRNRIWGEFLRIKVYGEQGDIYYGPEVKYLVDKIIKLTS